jgi:MiaB/RimO family radical SAM methylthiotransferase
VEQIKKLVGNGYREIVLTGVDITSYGPDLPGQPTLGKLTQQILRHVPDLPRLRISSIDSIEADEAFYDAIGSDRRLMPHLHLSLQSGDDMILKRMKRRHLRADAFAVVEKLRSLRPEIVFGADIIAGFPTETDEMFENSLEFIETANLTYIHAFPYSPRPGTPAARMPQVEKAVAKARANRLRALGSAQIEKLAADYLATRGEAEHISAVSISLSLPGQPGNLNVTAGRLSLDQGAGPVTPDTLFQIGSITKSMTAYMSSIVSDGAMKGPISSSWQRPQFMA